MYARLEGRCFRRVASSLKPVVSIYVRIDQDGSSCGGHDFGRDAPQPGPNQSGQAPASEGYERGLHLLGGFEEHVGRVAAGDPGRRPAPQYFLQLTGTLFEHAFIPLAHLREVLDRGPRLAGRNLGQIGMRVDKQTLGTVELADGGGELSCLARVVGEVLADDDPGRMPEIFCARKYEDGDLGVVHDLLGLASHQDAPHRSQSAAADDQEISVDLLAEGDDFVGGAPPPEIRLRDFPTGGPDLLYLFVQYLLALAPQLPLDEVVGEPPHIVPDVNDMKLGPASPGQIRGRLCRPDSVLRAVGRQQYSLRKHAQLKLLSSSMLSNASPNNTLSRPFGSGSSARRDGLAKLAAVEVRIQAVLLYQHGMAAALRDVAILYDEDEVGVPDSAQAVGDDDARSALQ